LNNMVDLFSQLFYVQYRRIKKMAVKKAAPVKTVAASKSPAKKVAEKQVSRKGQSLECGVCGLSVTIDEDCGCVGFHDIICCGKPMKAKKPKAKAKAA
jgi:hypothetical protein